MIYALSLILIRVIIIFFLVKISPSLPTWAIIVIVLGSLLVMAIVLLAWYCVKQPKDKQEVPNSTVVYFELFVMKTFKANLHYTCGITLKLKRVTNGGAHLRGIAPGLHKTHRSGGNKGLLRYGLVRNCGTVWSDFGKKYDTELRTEFLGKVR